MRTPTAGRRRHHCNPAGRKTDRCHTKRRGRALGGPSPKARRPVRLVLQSIAWNNSAWDRLVPMRYRSPSKDGLGARKLDTYFRARAANLGRVTSRVRPSLNIGQGPRYGRCHRARLSSPIDRESPGVRTHGSAAGVFTIVSVRSGVI